METPNYSIRPATVGYQSEWQGLTSKKFDAAERVHFAPRDMMKTIEGMDLPFLGRKHFQPFFGKPMEENLSLKTFPKIHNKESDMSALKSLQKLAYAPPPKKISKKLITNLSNTSLKVTKGTSLIRPASFVSIREKPMDKQTESNHSQNYVKNTVAGGTSAKEATFFSTKGHTAANKLSWEERDRIQERMNDVMSVKSLSEWEDLKFAELQSKLKLMDRLRATTAKPMSKREFK